MAKTNKSGTRIFYVPDLLYVYTDSYEMSPTQRISEVIPWTKQVGVGAPTQRISEEIPWTKQVGVEAPTERISEEIPRTKQVGVGAPTERIFEEIPRTKQVGVGEKTGDNEFYPSLAFILIRGILQS
ncbi:PTS beta-glucoside transporter [Staphylococcus epidermidis]|uniref:Uncharacterized protein n=1 Tax=Staphylococcus epidermidis TaxID=1282 RepID=A0A4Y7VT53_STAEP|nr:MULTISPECIES: hypothetical protein [Staphylococcus]AUJ74885.1 PTS beta-glucoside transporter [Staphylococcus epidermidis]EJE30872.1 hypothetical protein HMPREF9972_07453 [Staphylococcus epidermidis NIH04008]EJE44431.1 hypothetical protein HMPREF1386_08242 [Staphylococcus epidermidis NIH051668]KAB2159702.1 hypothetical protein F9B20_11670 [Staphylococcus epidermidis]KAB2166121.1 hypothetical protein F9B37_11360 [Staphylococcus epidermidis]